MAEDRKEIHRLLRAMNQYDASDLHLKVGLPPLLRLVGEMRPLEMDPLNEETISKLVNQVMRPEHQIVFEDTGDMDFAYSLGDEGRFRFNIFRQRGYTSAAIRRVQMMIPTFEELYLPPVLNDIANYRQGLVVITGITGSGKSTTLAALLNYIAQNRRCHIITVEDPIEFLFRDNKAFVNQREVGLDVGSWETALKYLMRQDPDVVMLSDMRDMETFRFGLTAAETGHLVFGSMHSSSTSSAFGRILDLFPRDRHKLIRTSLQFNLKAIVAQKLLPSILEGVGRVPACEIMLSTPTVRKLIREEQDQKIPDAIRAGKEDGMQDFTEALRDLVDKDWIERAVALEQAPNPEALRMALKGITTGESGILG